MSQNNNIVLAILGGSFMIALAVIFYAVKMSPSIENTGQIAKSQEPSNYIEDINLDDDPVLGDENAPVTLVEFSDYQCGYCRRHFQQVFPLIKKNYIDTGKVKMVFRDAANLGQKSLDLANAASCAQKLKDDEAYFALHNAIYSGESSTEGLSNVAMDFGIDKERFLECANNLEMQEEVALDTLESREYGVKGTPAFFINGQRVIGAQPYEVFVQAIESQLK